MLVRDLGKECRVRLRGIGSLSPALTALLLAAIVPPSAGAQPQTPSEQLLIEAKSASTWSQGTTNVIQLDGPVTIRLDRATMRADRAVIWVTPVREAAIDQQRAQISLIGNAVLEQDRVRRSDDQLFVTAAVRGTIRITAAQRLARDLTQSDLYAKAAALRQAAAEPPAVPPPATPAAPAPAAAPPRPTDSTPTILAPPPSRITPRPTGREPGAPPPPPPTPSTRPTVTVDIIAPNLATDYSADANVAVVLSGGVTVVVHDGDDFIELKGERAVVFTPLKSLTGGQADRLKAVEDVAQAVYMEGDARAVYTRAQRNTHNPKDRPSESRLTADRIYYDITTRRAVLTDAVVHTLEPMSQTPVIVRARFIRQLALGEYNATGVELSTSAFATPSYSLRADRAYLREDRPGEESDLSQRRELFVANDVTLDMFGLPVFWLPAVGGTMTEGGLPLRRIGIENSRRFGFGLKTEWGLFESLGEPRPRDLDVSYIADYFSDRGPAFGLNARYGGGFVTETTKDPWNFEGDFKSFFVLDSGKDDLNRPLVDPPEYYRGRVLWEHQHFFPNDWQMQLRAGWVSDATFLEQWFQDEFDNGRPHNEEAYFKRQRDSEAFSLLLSFQPMGFVTTGELQQEQFEIDRAPEFTYRRIGDSFADDQLTFYSDNTLSRLRYNPSEATLARQAFVPSLNPGLPSIGPPPEFVHYDASGRLRIPTSWNYRGDFRQEVDFPLNADRFKLMPYVLGRYTGYSDSPLGSAKDRFFGGAGLRVNTAFWKVDPTAESDLFDVHQVRHVIEPELHLFTSAMSVDRNDIFHYDEPIDEIDDVSAVELALHQRWQTKRGGPGRWRSVDFFTLNVAADLYANKPRDRDVLPNNFRGIFFPSMPEASIPRDSINADATWRISDSTLVLADESWNINERELATASIGLAAQRDTRLGYFLGLRYISASYPPQPSTPLAIGTQTTHSTIATIAANYELSQKYSLLLEQSFDFTSRSNLNTQIMLIRKFDRFFMAVKFFHDETNNESGVSFNIYPEGLGYGADVFSTVQQR